ncbi:MAG: hypothetical protein F4Y42_02975 [Caldilineaceae bacterium SB0664_bin_27]|uniref:Uncharacterized protein n=1 Tax=Caldilineaceae bacterium SB0664_bin_27 TaxID=2605260 RepID=A0A6B0YQD6_9CHLR|nr:hypothetical protein [Caldilineaceae bacterium SB0664_bin_27]
MTYEAAFPRFSPRKSRSRSRAIVPAKARMLLPVKWQPSVILGKKYNPRFFLAMAVSIVSSISFLWVLLLVIAE